MSGLARSLSVLIALVMLALPASATKETANDVSNKSLKSTVKTANDTLRDGWSFSQTSQLLGPSSIVISARGVKVTSLKQSVSLLCVSPFSEVILFSDRTKKYCVMPFDTFRCPVTKTLSVVNCGLVADTPIIARGNTVYKTLDVHKFESTPAFDTNQMARYRANEVPSRAHRNVIAYSTDKFKQDPLIGLVLERFFGIPKMPGIAVYLDFLAIDGDHNIYLATDKVVKTRVADLSFSLPPTYKKVARHEDLFVSADTADEMNLIMMEKR